jgi:cytochrome bd-type quinol oxidase subunit 2
MDQSLKNNINHSKNILSDFKTPKIYVPIFCFIIFLIIIMLLILFKVPFSLMKTKTKSQEEVVQDVFIVLFFVLLIVVLCITFLPNFKDLKKLFEQISNVTYIIIYTIFLILFFTLVPSDTLNTYAKYITPITIILGAFMFYKSYKSDYLSEFNLNYERIKTLIMLFCLLTIFIIYYNTDPGGYISKYFGYTLLLTIILGFFAFLYLIVVLTLPDDYKSTTSKSSNYLENFSKFSVFGSISFILFLIIMTILLSTYPGGFFNDKSTSAVVMILLLIICIVWSILLAGNMFPEFSDKSMNIDKINLFKRALLALFGFVISALIIFWLVYNIQNLSGQSSVVSLILNILLVVIILALIYKTVVVKIPGGNAKKSGFFNVIMNLLFYIPCLFSGLFDSITKLGVNEYNASNTSSLIMLVIAIIIFIIYFTMPSIFNLVNLQGGKQLVNRPVYTDSQYILGTYEELNGSDQFDYQYAISFWIFIDSAGPNMNSSYEKYTSLLNFGKKPNVLYNGKTNSLMITMEQKDLHKTKNNKLIDFDENGNRIIYKNHNMLLQKWNNIIINYTGGVLDIFLNGELVKSEIEIVPYYTLDNLTIGEENGLKGGICNVVYFRRALTTNNIYYLYNMVKNKTPPITNESNTTIISNNISTLGSSINQVV